MSSNVLTAPVIPASVFTEASATGIAVSVRGVSKSYRIAQNAVKHTTVGEALMHKLKNPFEKPGMNEFWALKDVSFDIQKGDVVGIIGRNGAGKSTLLKILSRITEPTTGTIDLYGRVGSLLEVGTGFHPELTGRENIFLNGSILGMSKTEITRQFDAIVDFSGTEKFLDTPVKRYSSGMYVRLAFAVAAHLNPEILIVDEVLAVGDADFQKKCMGKMQDVAQGGRTVLFVSHNMAAVQKLCTAGIMLKSGQVAAAGPIEGVLQEYAQSRTASVTMGSVNKHGVSLAELALRDTQTGNVTNEPVFNRDYELSIRIDTQERFVGGSVVCEVRDDMDILVASICTLEEGVDSLNFDRSCEVTFPLPHLQLLPGNYKVSVFLYRPNDRVAYLQEENALSFSQQSAHVRGGAWSYQPRHGFVRISEGAAALTDGLRRSGLET